MPGDLRGLPTSSRDDSSVPSWLPQPGVLPQLEQRRNCRVDPTKGVVVHDRTHQTSVFGQGPGLRLDDLSCQDAADRRQERVAVQEVHIARKLLDGFEAGNPLDLYSPVPSVCQTVLCSAEAAATLALRDGSPRRSGSTLTTVGCTSVISPRSPSRSSSPGSLIVAKGWTRSCSPHRRLRRPTQPASPRSSAGPHPARHRAEAVDTKNRYSV
jgi:hypothetical protein